MVDLGSGRQALLTDTVGFIRKLPHHLIASFRSTLEEAREAEEAAAAEKPDVEELIRQAYLRTLSRFPDQYEMEIANRYIREGEALTDGLRGLLWALLNTREFIVNH